MDDILDTELEPIEELEDKTGNIPEFVAVPKKFKWGLSKEIDHQVQYVAYVQKYYGGESAEYKAAVDSLKSLCEAKNLKHKDAITLLQLLLQIAGGGFFANRAIKLIAQLEMNGCAFSSKGFSAIAAKLIPGMGKFKI